MAAKRFVDRVKAINASTGAQWATSTVLDYAEALEDGNLTDAQLTAVGEQAAETRERNRRRVTLLANNLGLPSEFVSGFVDSYLEYGDVELALTELRQSDTYATYFPGNRRDDGTVRYTERQYQQVVESYAATLEDFGVNPDLYAPKFGDLVAGDVSPDEFLRRVDSINRAIVQAPPEVREAFAADFGVPGVTDASTILGVALAPDIGEAVRERRIAIAQVTGQANRFGFNRSRQRVESLLNAGLSADQAASLYSGAPPTLRRLGGSAAVTGERFGITEFEDAVVSQDTTLAQRLSSQESARWSQAGRTVTDRDNALIGLRRR